MDSIKSLIIETATLLFHQNGIRNVSIDNVCTELRISKKTFYSYFAKKEDLVEEVIISLMNHRMNSYAKSTKSLNAIDRFIFSIKHFKRLVENESFLMWKDLDKYYPALSKKLNLDNDDKMIEGFERTILQGIEEGFFRKDLDVELLSNYHSIQIKYTFQKLSESVPKFSAKRMMEFYVDLMIHLIANENGLKYISENYKMNEHNEN